MGSSANTSHVNSAGLGGSSFLSGITSPLLSRSLASFNPLSGYSSMTEKPQFTSRFLKKGNIDSLEQSERYSDNGNLSLRASVGADVVVRGAGLKGVLARLDEPSINRSSSGSSHGSGGSGGSGTGSSGYHSDHIKERVALKKSHIEFEDSEGEGGDTVIVTGGLNFVKGDKAIVNSQVKTEKSSKMPDGLTNSISSFLKKTDHFTENYKNSQRDSDMSGVREYSGEDLGSSYRTGRSSSVARASSVSRQFDAPASSFTRAGSVSRGFESSSRDPFYSQLNKSTFSSLYRPTNHALSPLRENRILSPTQSDSFTTPPQSKYAIKEAAKPAKAKFISLEDECNWILSGREPEEDDDDDENTLDDISGDELSEMTVDLNDETHTATTDRPDNTDTDLNITEKQAKTNGKKKERKRSDIQTYSRKSSSNSVASSRYDFEMPSSRLQINGINHTFNSDDDDAGLYRGKYERAVADLDFTKRRLVEQHEEDMEQLMMLKKQLEKKINEAYDEVDEQKKDTAQWKNKYKKVQNEMDDTRILLEEQNEKNDLLERKFRKVDSELIEIQQEIHREASVRNLLEKDMEALRKEKTRLNEELHSLRLDVETKDGKIRNLSSEIDDLQNNTVNEEELKRVKRQKQDIDNRLKDQIEEMDDLSGQVQELENEKTKLEMTMNQVKKEHKHELEMKEEETEDVRHAFGKKLKVVEQQLEEEHEDRIGFLREKHDMEGKILNLQEMLERSAEDEGLVAKLKKDLKRTKALLKDAHHVVENSQTEGTNKVIIRQLKNQLEDAEYARSAAVKAKQSKDLELADVQQQLEEIKKEKRSIEEKSSKFKKEKADLTTQLEEKEEELQEVITKYKASVSAVSADQMTIQNQSATIQELEFERNKLKDQYAEISKRLDQMGKEGENVDSAQQQKLELKIKELETKLELEKTTKGRMEKHISRQTDVIECLTKDMEDIALREKNAQEEQKKLARNIREMREEMSTLQGKEAELSHKKSDLEKQLEVAEAETVSVRNQLKVAEKRIIDLQAAIHGAIDSDKEDSDDEGMEDFLEHHRRAMSVQRERSSMARDSMIRELSAPREIRASMPREVRASMPREVRASMPRDIRASMPRDIGASIPREPIAMPRDSRDIRSMSRDIRASVAKEFEAATRDLPPVEEAKEIHVIKETPFESIAEVD